VFWIIFEKKNKDIGNMRENMCVNGDFVVDMDILLSQVNFPFIFERSNHFSHH